MIRKSWLVALAGISFPAIAANATAAPEAGSAPIATPAQKAEDELDVLKRQLAAQEAINAQLRARITLLEQQVAANVTGPAPAVQGLDASAPPPPPADIDAAGQSAIERSLVSRGLVLLPKGRLLVTPTFSWGHAGAGDMTSNSYVSSLTLETGLPWGMAAGVSIPYLRRETGVGSADGWGDVVVSLAKRLTVESDKTPSLIVRASYSIPTGSSPFVLPSIGSGFEAFTLGLSGSKRIDPVVLYGNIGYSHAFAKMATITTPDGAELFNGNIQPGDDLSFGGGVTLAATPDISLDAGVSLSLSGKSRYRYLENGQTSQSTRSTSGYMSVGAGFVLARNFFLNVTSSAGITDDSADFIFSVALPFRF